MNIDTKSIAAKLHSAGRKSTSINIMDDVTEALLDALQDELVRLSDEVITEMKELEHEGPQSKDEYEEMIGMWKDQE